MKAGDIYLSEIKTGAIRESKPVLVISSNEYTEMVIVLKIASTKPQRKSRYVVEFEEDLLNRRSYIDIRTVTSLSTKELLNKVGQIRDQTLDEISELLPTVFDNKFSKVELQYLANEYLEKNRNETAESLLQKEILSPLDKRFDIFLSHSYLDVNEILGLQHSLEIMGFTVYVDSTVDHQLDRSKVNRQTASVLRERMKNSSSMLYATSINSRKSRWMPWELGYFDGIKEGFGMIKKIGILPIQRSVRRRYYPGEEYLNLYHFITKKNDKMLIFEDELGNSLDFKQWLMG